MLACVPLLPAQKNSEGVYRGAGVLLKVAARTGPKSIWYYYDLIFYFSFGGAGGSFQKAPLPLCSQERCETTKSALKISQ